MGIRNCLGITIEDLKRDLFASIDAFLLKWILSQKCGGGSDGEAALANFDAFNVFSAKKALDYLNNADLNNRHLKGDDVYGFLTDMMDSLLKDFARRECTGKNNGINDLVSGYKPNPYTNMYPNTITVSEKQALMDILKDTNFNSDNRYQFKPDTANKFPYVLINETDTDGASDLVAVTDLFGDSILSKIPINTIDAFDIDKTQYTKCFKTVFSIDNFIVPDDRKSRPIITEQKVLNIRRIHEDILLPIYRYYFPEETDTSCRLRIHGGLTSVKTAYTLLGSSLDNLHISGEAVNFSFTSISSSAVVEDLRSGKINVEFGYCVLVNGIFITLPLEFEGHDVRGVVISSPSFDDADVRIEFA